MRFTDEDDDELLTPREVAEIFGVRTTTIARWSREGRLAPLRTPGGHRRFTRSSVRAVLEQDAQEEPGRDIESAEFVEDAVRMYEQGWGIRQVATRFDVGYGTMRRILRKHATLRTRGSQPLPDGLRRPPK